MLSFSGQRAIPSNARGGIPLDKFASQWGGRVPWARAEGNLLSSCRPNLPDEDCSGCSRFLTFPCSEFLSETISCSARSTTVNKTRKARILTEAPGPGKTNKKLTKVVNFLQSTVNKQQAASSKQANKQAASNKQQASSKQQSS